MGRFRRSLKYPPHSIRPVYQGKGGRSGLMDTPWGRCVTAFDQVMTHANSTPGTNLLLAASTPLSFSNMHRACEYYLPQAAAKRVNGIWIFPNAARLRIARVSTQDDVDKLLKFDFSLISVQAESEVITLLQPLLTLNGRIIPFLGYY